MPRFIAKPGHFAESISGLSMLDLSKSRIRPCHVRTLESATRLGQQTGDSFLGPKGGASLRPRDRFHTPVRCLQGFCCPFRQWARADGVKRRVSSWASLSCLLLTRGSVRTSTATTQCSVALAMVQQQQLLLFFFHADPSHRGFRVPSGWLLRHNQPRT